jgi:hypothetical protein
VEGLHSTTSLAKLSLSGCKFDSEATSVFVGFMKQPKGTIKMSIRVLVISRAFHMFANTTMGKVAASILTMPETQGDTTRLCSTIGSSLQVLELDRASVFCDFVGFCDAFGASASQIRLPCLRSESILYSDLTTLNRCLPELVYLRELDIHDVDETDGAIDPSGALNFVRALRQNGSLFQVTIPVLHREGVPYLNESESLRVETYCKRNRALPTLLAKPLIGSHNNGDHEKTDLSLFPTLFDSAKQALRTAPNAMLIGLLAAGDSIGPILIGDETGERKCERKRTR